KIGHNLRRGLGILFADCSGPGWARNSAGDGRNYAEFGCAAMSWGGPQQKPGGALAAPPWLSFRSRNSVRQPPAKAIAPTSFDTPQSPLSKPTSIPHIPPHARGSWENWSTRSRDKRRREAGKPVNRLGEAFDTYHPAATRVKGGQKRRSRADALIFGQTAQPENAIGR